MASCIGGQCQLGCGTGTHVCGAMCASNTSPESCGTSCTPCPAKANATATCTSGMCGSQCNTGFHDCGGVCVSDADVATCGQRCMTCPAGPANSTPSCASGACDFTCTAPYARCGSGCCLAFDQLSAGGNAACGVTALGTVKCWGLMSPVVNSNVAMPVTGLSGVRKVSMGSTHACALLNDAGISCWGSNTYGQASGTASTYNTPSHVAGLPAAQAVAAGARHTCVLLTTGAPWCWGNPYYPAAANNGSTPALVVDAGLGVDLAVSTQSTHSCLVKSDAGLTCWGHNSAYELGTVDFSNTAPQSALASNVAKASLGYQFSCVRTRTGGVQCWGYCYDNECGFPSYMASPTPQSAFTSGVSALVTGGYSNTCAVLDGGGVSCWGMNNLGQLGNGQADGGQPYWLPQRVLNVTTAKDVAVGDDFACALLNDGRAMCWGNNAYGQLGAGSDAGASYVPVEVVR